MPETKKRWKNKALWLLTILLGLAFLMSGGMKLTGPEAMIANFARWGYPAWFLYVIGVVEVLAAISLVVPRLTAYAAAELGGIMVGATFQPELFHVMKKIALPVILSCVVLVGVGAIKAIVFTRLGMLDLPGNESGGNERPDRNGIRQPGPTHAGGLFSFRAGGVCPPHRLVRI